MFISIDEQKYLFVKFKIFQTNQSNHPASKIIEENTRSLDVQDVVMRVNLVMQSLHIFAMPFCSVLLLGIPCRIPAPGFPPILDWFLLCFLCVNWSVLHHLHNPLDLLIFTNLLFPQQIINHLIPQYIKFCSICHIRKFLSSDIEWARYRYYTFKIRSNAGCSGIPTTTETDK